VPFYLSVLELVSHIGMNMTDGRAVYLKVHQVNTPNEVNLAIYKDGVLNTLHVKC